MARNFFRIFTENNPVMGDRKTLCIPEAKGLKNISIFFISFTPLSLGSYVLTQTNRRQYD